jgi:hypothetical protein
VKTAPKPVRRALGLGWAALFLSSAAVSVLLWAGIGADRLAHLGARLGTRAPIAFGAAVFLVFVALPLALPGSPSRTRVRSFQVGALLVSLLALAGAVALRVDSLMPTAQRGLLAVRTLGDAAALPSSDAPAVGASSGAAEPELRACLERFLTGEFYRAEGVGEVAPGYADTFTRKSARRTADKLVKDASYPIGVALAANAEVPPEQRAPFTRLNEKLEQTRARATSLSDREALAEAFALQAEVDALLYSNEATKPGPEAAQRAKDKAGKAAAAARCEVYGSTAQCLAGQLVLEFIREDAAWRVDRPGEGQLILTGFMLAKPNEGPRADPQGDELAQALVPLDAVLLIQVRLEHLRSLDPGLVDNFADDAVPTVYTSTNLFSRFAVATALQQTLIDSSAATRFTQAADQVRGEAACDPRAALRKLMGAYNDALGPARVTSRELRDDAKVESALAGQLLKRVSADEYEVFQRLPAKEKDTLARVRKVNGRWLWWVAKENLGPCQPH